MSEFKFNCPYCQQKFSAETKDIGKEAICPSCQKEITITPPLEDEKNKMSPITPTPQAEQTEQANPEAVKNNTKDAVIGCMGCLVIIASLVGLIMWVYHCWTAPPKNVDMSVTTTPKKADIHWIWNVAKEAVCKELRRPEAATFPKYWDPDVKIIKHDDETYAIMGFVDTDLPGKGKMRLYWATRVQYTSREKWEAEPVGWYAITPIQH